MEENLYQQLKVYDRVAWNRPFEDKEMELSKTLLDLGYLDEINNGIYKINKKGRKFVLEKEQG